MDDFIPVGVWKFFGGVATLDAGTVEEDGWLDFGDGCNVFDELAGVGLVGKICCDDKDLVA